MSTFSVFGLSYGRSGNEICAEEGQNPIFDPLPRNEKLYVCAGLQGNIQSIRQQVDSLYPAHSAARTPRFPVVPFLAFKFSQNVYI